MQFSVENVKCGGCVKTIQNSLAKVTGVTSVTVEQGQGLVTVEGEGFTKEQLVTLLAGLGYPEKV